MIQCKSEDLSLQEKQYVDLASELSNQPYDIELWEKQGAQQKHLEDQSKQVAEKSLKIAADLCIYTNDSITVLEI